MKSLTEALLERHVPTGSRALGSEVALLATRGNMHDARHAADRLSMSARQLLASTHKADIEAAHGIQQTFLANDFSAFRHTFELDEKPGQRHILDWLAQASLRDMVTFGTFNTDRLTTFQRRLDSDFDLFRHRTMQKVTGLTDISLFPDTAKPLFEQTLDTYGAFTALDSFESGGKQVDGFCDDETLAIANLYTRREDFCGLNRRLFNVIFHETLHGVGNSRGFFFGIDTPHDYLRLPEEAFVSHAEAVADSPTLEEATIDRREPHIINPADRYPGIGAYADEREFFALVLGHPAEAPLPIDAVADAYFSAREPSGKHSRRRQLEQHMGRYFSGEARFFAAMDQYEQVGTHIERTELTQRWIDAYYGTSEFTPAAHLGDAQQPAAHPSVRER